MPKRTHKLSANSRFASLCKYISAVQDELTGIMRTDVDALGIYAARDVELRNVFKACERAAGRKRKYEWRKAMEYSECVAVNKRHMEAGNEIVARFRTEVRVCKEAQFLLAPECDIAAEKSKRTRAFFTGWSRTYWSQGFGASKYAREDAEEQADKARMYDVECRIDASKTEMFSGPGGSTRSVDYTVMVHLTKIGCEMLRALPSLNLRERVRLCWKRGVNPRVYIPFLPHGYEESRGLNFFGGEAKA